MDTVDNKSYILSLFSNTKPLLGSSSDDDDVDETKEIIFQVTFYTLFAAMLLLFWYVFKKQGIQK